MLHDFYLYQNSQKSNSVHATYLVYGTKASQNDPSNGDVDMTGASGENDDASEEVPTATLTLVSEERLKGCIGPCSLSNLPSSN
jgi:DNA polymerase delta subunit 3